MRGATVAFAQTPIEKRISIHAPMRGATHPNALKILIHLISIHAPMRGATFNAASRHVRG